jgi:hypothetical protein
MCIWEWEALACYREKTGFNETWEANSTLRDEAARGQCISLSSNGGEKESAFQWRAKCFHHTAGRKANPFSSPSVREPIVLPSIGRSAVFRSTINRF